MAVHIAAREPAHRDEAFAETNVLTQRRRQQLRSLNLLPHLAEAKIHKVSQALQTFCSNNILHDMTIRSLDVGGGGDCFYHSVAAGLERLLLHSTAASRHVLRRIPLHIFSQDRRAVVKYLRNLCAEQILRWSPEELLDYFVNATFRQQLRTWQDDWNPTHMLESSGLSCIIGCDTVSAVSDDPNGDPGDIILILDK